MGKFNSSVKGNSIKFDIVNNEGHGAFSMKEKDKLVTQVFTTFFNEKKFYGDNSNNLLNTAREVMKVDCRFVANLAIYARDVMNLRSVSHVLIAELAKHIHGKQYVRQLINKAVIRVDDMTEILSCYINNYGKPIPNSMKKGLADSFKKFNEFQLAKYNRNNEVRLKDVLCLTHVKPQNKEQSDLFKRVLEGRLKTPETWETKLSTQGNNKKSWDELLDKNKVGYMALLRNLRNIINSGADIDKVINILTDTNNVLKSRQLPFRFYSAYKVLKENNIGTSKIFNALEKAIKISTKNIKQLKGKTLIAADVSGSMAWGSVSGKSDVKCSDISTLLLSIGNYICEDSILTTFDTNLYNVTLPSDNGIISNSMSIPANGGGTRLELPLKYLIQNGINVDRIIILSDNEINNGWRDFTVTCQSLINNYRSKINKDVWVHAVDLQGYGTQQFKGEKINIIAGWSEKIFEFINMIEEGSSSMINEIENYYF